MDLKSIAYSIVGSVLINGLLVGSAVAWVIHHDTQGTLKGILIGGAILASLCIIIALLILASRADSISGKLAFLVFIQIMAFFFCGAAAAWGIARPQGFLVDLRLPDKESYSPFEANLDSVKEHQRFRDGKAAAMITLMSIGTVLELLLSFILIRARESISILRRSDELPDTLMWNAACGEDPAYSSSSGNSSEYEDDPEYGSRRRKKKPTFSNKEKYHSDSDGDQSEKPILKKSREKPVVQGRIVPQEKTRQQPKEGSSDHSSSDSSDEVRDRPNVKRAVVAPRRKSDVPIGRKGISEYPSLSADSIESSGVSFGTVGNAKRGNIVSNEQVPSWMASQKTVESIDSTALSFSRVGGARRGQVAPKDPSGISDWSGVSPVDPIAPTKRAVAQPTWIASQKTLETIESSGISFNTVGDARRGQVVSKDASGMSDWSGVSPVAPVAPSRRGVVQPTSMASQKTLETIDSSGMSFSPVGQGRRAQVVSDLGPPGLSSGSLEPSRRTDLSGPSYTSPAAAGPARRGVVVPPKK